VRTGTDEFLDTCNGLFDTATGEVVRETCEYQALQISPNRQYVVAPPSQFDGNGPLEISVLDTATLTEAGRFAPEGGFIGSWAWSADGQLVFDAFDGASWHLYTMAPDTGALTEVVDPVKGDERSPFTLVQR